jgi:hypothetical protein
MLFEEQRGERPPKVVLTPPFNIKQKGLGISHQ